jgi:hypothetical protein
MRRCADSMDRECGARLQAMSRRMEDAEGAVWTVGRRQVVFVQSRSLMSCCEGVTVREYSQDPSFGWRRRWLKRAG